MNFDPIGFFHTDAKYPYEARRQPTAHGCGEIRLCPGQAFEQAAHDLVGFERIWIIYQFHHNPQWKPKTMPPRGPRVKRGVFATRAPYRPNAIGLSCVRLLRVDGLSIFVEGHDILNETPVLDIKPYLPYADAFPDAKTGWLEEIEGKRWQVEFSAHAEKQIAWLEARGLLQLRGFIVGQLEFDPLDHKRKRVEALGEDYQIAYRTWRANFTVGERSLTINDIRSGYSPDDLAASDDRHSDKSVHRAFLSALGPDLPDKSAINLSSTPGADIPAGGDPSSPGPYFGTAHAND